MREEKLKKLEGDIESFLQERQTLNLSTITNEGLPFASYAPFAMDDKSFYVLLSDVALHGIYLANNPVASILVSADEVTSKQLFAIERVNYAAKSELVEYQSEGWQKGIDCLVERFGERITGLASHADFNLYRLTPQSGRYVVGFGKAYAIKGEGFLGDSIEHLRDGHKKREEEAA